MFVRVSETRRLDDLRKVRSVHYARDMREQRLVTAPLRRGQAAHAEDADPEASLTTISPELQGARTIATLGQPDVRGRREGRIRAGRWPHRFSPSCPVLWGDCPHRGQPSQRRRRCLSPHHFALPAQASVPGDDVQVGRGRGRGQETCPAGALDALRARPARSVRAAPDRGWSHPSRDAVPRRAPPLQASPLFRDLPADEISDLARDATMRRAGASADLVVEGEPLEEWFVVAAGVLRVLRRLDTAESLDVDPQTGSRCVVVGEMSRYDHYGAGEVMFGSAHAVRARSRPGGGEGHRHLTCPSVVSSPRCAQRPTRPSSSCPAAVCGI